MENRTAWDDWSRIDPMWAIATDPDRRHGKWDAEEFFASGRAAVDDLWDKAADLGLARQNATALDFGCGVGRLTRALAARVGDVLGLDISPGMIDLARLYNTGYDNVEFDVHAEQDLRRFAAARFDVVCCLLVLQHIPQAEVAEGYVGELVRVLAPGGILMLQLAEEVTLPETPKDLRSRLRPRTRLAGALRAAGVSPHLLYRYLHWEPDMPMNPIPQGRATELIECAGGEVVWSRPSVEDGVSNRIYLITRH